MYLAKNSSYEGSNNNYTVKDNQAPKFFLSNRSAARKTIKASNFGLHWDSKYHDEHHMLEVEK